MKILADDVSSTNYPSEHGIELTVLCLVLIQDDRYCRTGKVLDHFDVNHFGESRVTQQSMLKSEH